MNDNRALGSKLDTKGLYKQSEVYGVVGSSSSGSENVALKSKRSIPSWDKPLKKKLTF